MPHVDKMPVKLMVNIYGDWGTVVGIHRDLDGTEEFGDRVYNSLLDQKPYDEDSAEHSSYRVLCKTEREALNVMRAVVKNHLRYTIAMESKSADKAYHVYMESSEPYSNRDSYCSLQVPEPIDAVTNAKAVLACKGVRDDLAANGLVSEGTLAMINAILDGVRKYD